jgi:hypothetical protein
MGSRAVHSRFSWLVALRQFGASARYSYRTNVSSHGSVGARIDHLPKSRSA